MLKEKIAQISLVLFLIVISLPIPLKYSSIALIICIFSLLWLNFEKGKKYTFKNVFLYLCVAFFLVDTFRNLFHLDFNKPFIQDGKLSFIIIPIVFLNSVRFLKKNINLILYSFLIGVTIYILYAWGFALHFYYIKYPEYYSFSLTDGYLRYMLYNYLPGAIHHTYIGMYIVFSILILFVFTFLKKKINFFLGISVMGFYLFSLLYLGGKMTVFLVGFLLVVALLKKIKIKMKTILFSFLAIVGVITFFLFFNNSDWVLMGINHSLDSRLEIYTCGFKASTENIVWGLGHFNFEKVITDYCPSFSLFNKFIPHNIFIRELLGNGIVGISILIGLVFFIFKTSLKSRNILFLSLSIMLLIIGSIEDVLYLQRGVIFFVFFITLFYVIHNDEKGNINIQK